VRLTGAVANSDILRFAQLTTLFILLSHRGLDSCGGCAGAFASAVRFPDNNM
jgi:hypothetical protein